MSRTPRPRRTGSTTADVPEGLISGHLLALIRDRLNLSQERLAEHLAVDVNTVRSWERGRRSLGQTSVQKLRGIIRKLRQLGADQRLLDQLDTAIDVDLTIAEIMRGEHTTGGHPLATWVSTRDWSELLAWAVGGSPPTALRNGLIVPGPRLAVPAREGLFTTLRAAAEQATTDDPAAALLRRQVYFLTALDRTGPGQDWLATQQRRELRRLHRGDDWTPAWAVGRSLAVARAAQGEPDQLRSFITNQLSTDRQEIANLRYWSYWVGELATTATGDDFMAAGDLGSWRGIVLLEHLVAGMKPTTPYVELTVHTVWALLHRRPWLLDDDAGLTATLQTRARELLDHADLLGDQARTELGQVFYATKMRGRR